MGPGNWGSAKRHVPRADSRQQELQRASRTKLLLAGCWDPTDALGLQGEEVGTGLLTYPALMAADILLYQVGHSGAFPALPPPLPNLPSSQGPVQ